MLQLSSCPRSLQEQFFQLWQRAPNSGAYNSGFTAVLQGPVDLAALQTAARLVFERQQVRQLPDSTPPCHVCVQLTTCECTGALRSLPVRFVCRPLCCQRSCAPQQHGSLPLQALRTRFVED